MKKNILCKIGGEEYSSLPIEKKIDSINDLFKAFISLSSKTINNEIIFNQIQILNNRLVILEKELKTTIKSKKHNLNYKSEILKSNDIMRDSGLANTCLSILKFNYITDNHFNKNQIIFDNIKNV